MLSLRRELLTDKEELPHKEGDITIELAHNLQSRLVSNNSTEHHIIMGKSFQLIIKGHMLCPLKFGKILGVSRHKLEEAAEMVFFYFNFCLNNNGFLFSQKCNFVIFLEL